MMVLSTAALHSDAPIAFKFMVMPVEATSFSHALQVGRRFSPSKKVLHMIVG
jgi:enolase